MARTLQDFDVSLGNIEGMDFGGDNWDGYGAKGGVLAQTLVARAYTWVHDLASLYLEVFQDEMPMPCPLPCGPSEVVLEWSDDHGIYLGASLSEDDDCDYYGENRFTGEIFHGLFPATPEKNRQIIVFLYNYIVHVPDGTTDVPAK